MKCDFFQLHCWRAKRRDSRAAHSWLQWPWSQFKAISSRLLAEKENREKCKEKSARFPREPRAFLPNAGGFAVQTHLNGLRLIFLPKHSRKILTYLNLQCFNRKSLIVCRDRKVAFRYQDRSPSVSWLIRSRLPIVPSSPVRWMLRDFDWAVRGCVSDALRVQLIETLNWNSLSALPHRIYWIDAIRNALRASLSELLRGKREMVCSW